MIVILQGTAQYSDGYVIHKHRNRVKNSKGKLKYLKARFNEDRKLLKDLTLARDTKHDWQQVKYETCITLTSWIKIKISTRMGF